MMFLENSLVLKVCPSLQEIRTSAIAKPLELNELENGIKKSLISVQVMCCCHCSNTKLMVTPSTIFLGNG